MVKQIIKEAMEQNPLGLKEAVAEELRNRVALALEAKMEEMSGLEEAEVGKAGPAKLVSYGPKGDKVTASKIAAHLAKRANDYSGGNAELIKKLSTEISKHGDTTANELIGKHKTIAKSVGMDAKAAHNLISGAASALKESVDLEEAKMTDAEVLSAAKALAANGKDAKTKAFGKGLVDFYKKEGSFTPAQVGGLQNIMKNASFQMAKDK